MTVFFTSDTHFGHANVIKYCNRPFKDVDEMDATLIANWNERVQPNDTVYHIGDFSFKDPDLYAGKLNGQKFLVPGNHDKRNLKKLGQYFTILPGLYEHKFQLLDYPPGGEWSTQLVVMCHYNMRVWNKSHHGSWHIFGHSHGSLNHIKELGRAVDVGVDSNEYRPINFDKLSQIIATKPFVPIDHHTGERDG